uniref:Geranylgeranyl transferase type-2 subunit alpha n=1 Tax=Schistocephalus solidus TaxID=70667 RepID=A0A0X3NUX8_SCHSO
MHGQVKVRISQEQEAKRKEQKLQAAEKFSALTERVLARRNEGDYSMGTLEELSQLLEKSPDMFTLWNYRREILLDSKNASAPTDVRAGVFDKELLLTSRCLVNNPKSYATWHHRSWVMLHHPSPDWNAELDLCNVALRSDERNFHCWDYRRFVVQHSKVATSDELDFTTLSLEENFSNYSAWHYRSEHIGADDVVCTAATPVSPPPNSEFGSTEHSSNKLPWNELDLVHNAIFTDPADQAPWFYYWWLLGRGDKNSYLRELYLSRALQRAVLVFTSPKLSAAISHLRVDVTISDPNSNTIEKYTPADFGGWRSALTGNVSAVWWFALPNQYTEMCIVSVTVYTEDSIIGQLRNSSALEDSKTWLYCRMEPDQHESLTRVALDPRRLLNPIISPVHEPACLLSELDIVKELLSMEPKNKWALLTYVSLLRYIRPENAVTEIQSALSTLQKVDIQRNRYYEDMASAHLTEDVLITAYSTNSRSLNLSGVHLTRICCLDWCTLMTELDFSNNSLDYLPGTFAYLVCLTDLNLNNNRISTLKPIEGLPLLCRISVRQNAIADFKGLEPALACPRLRALDITGNMVADLPKFTILLSEHPGSKRSHQSLNVIYDKPVKA